MIQFIFGPCFHEKKKIHDCSLNNLIGQMDHLRNHCGNGPSLERKKKKTPTTATRRLCVHQTYTILEVILHQVYDLQRSFTIQESFALCIVNLLSNYHLTVPVASSIIGASSSRLVLSFHLI